MKKSNDPSAKYTSSYETLLKATYLYTGSTSEVALMLKVLNYEMGTVPTLIYAELSGDFPLGDSRQPTYKSLRPFDLVS